jgi:HK97 family phage prohead protease
MIDVVSAPLELKSVGAEASGEFAGYGAVFGNIDQAGDLIQPGAFAKTIASGRLPHMHLQHGIKQLGGAQYVGKWTAIAEDSHGLVVEGKIAGMGTDRGRYLFEQIRDGIFGGLSIGFRVAQGGMELGPKGGPRRIIKTADVVEVSLVSDPCNTEAQIREIKSSLMKTLLASGDHAAAKDAVAAAILLHSEHLTKGNSPTSDERAQLLTHLQDAHEALTGQRMPHGMKSAPTTIREFEAAMRELGYSNAKAKEIAALSFKAAAPRDEAVEQASVTADLAGLDLAGFKLPSFR